MVKPEDAANYLVTLYKRTNYQCEHRKLQKLIIYADMLYYLENDGNNLIERGCITASVKGISLDRISRGIYLLIINFNNARQKIKESEVDFKIKITMNAEYKYDETALSQNVQTYFYRTFLQIGAYSGKDLTDISRNTSLWSNARNDVIDDSDVVITNDMYDKFFQENNINSESSLFKHLKKQLCKKR